MDCRIDLYHTFYPLCINPWLYHASKHSSASIRSSLRAFLSGVIYAPFGLGVRHTGRSAGQDFGVVANSTLE